MNTFKEQLNGVFPPCVTVFHERDQSVAYDKIRENIEKYNQTEIRGFMPCGSNGEFRSLTDEESLKIIELYDRHRAKGKTILAGAGRESLSASLEFIHKAADRGADFASILPPHYFASKMSEEVLIEYYQRLADRSPIPILLYNIPKFAGGVVLSPALVKEVADHPNIAGMKDTSSEDIVPYCEAASDVSNFYILSGTIKKFFKGLSHGAVGGVLSVADYLPHLCCEIQSLYTSGHVEEAEKKELYANTLSDNAAGKFGVAGVKAAMDIVGYNGGDPRFPLKSITSTEKTALREVLVSVI